MKMTSARAVMVGMAVAMATPAMSATYLFNFTAPGYTGSGQFHTLDAAPTTVVGIDGLLNGNAITGLSSYAGANQTLLAAAPYFTLGGISFDAGGVSYNLYDYGGSGITNNIDNPGGGVVALTQLSTISITEMTGGVPEAATWAMMIFGFGMVGASARRRRNVVAA